MIVRSAERPRGARGVAGNYEYVRKVRASARGPRVSALVTLSLTNHTNLTEKLSQNRVWTSNYSLRHSLVLSYPHSLEE